MPRTRCKYALRFLAAHFKKTFARIFLSEVCLSVCRFLSVYVSVCVCEREREKERVTHLRGDALNTHTDAHLSETYLDSLVHCEKVCEKDGFTLCCHLMR
jgi:hypothetical protein